MKKITHILDAVIWNGKFMESKFQFHGTQDSTRIPEINILDTDYQAIWPEAEHV